MDQPNALRQHKHADSESPDNTTKLTSNVREYDDAFSSTADEFESEGEDSKLRPFNTPVGFCNQKVVDVEDGFVTRKRRRTSFSYWLALKNMVLRARRTGAITGKIEVYKDGFGVTEGLLASPKAYVRRARRKRSWYNYCIFCGISGLSIFAILLLFNVGLILATAFWASDFDPALQNWGHTGTGTEGLAWYPTHLTKDVLPIPCHSHNDYWRRVPLFSALRAGCTGTESDVWLFDEELYVGHNTASLTRNRTFQSLYVNPLVKILEQQNPHSDFYNGSINGVFDMDPEQSLILLIDVKTSGKETWPWVLKQLEPLRERGWLTFVQDGKVHNRPVTIVGTGNTPFDLLTANATYRDTFFDAPLELMWEHRNSSLTADTNSPENELLDTDLDANIPAVPSLDAGQGMTGISQNSVFDSTNSYYASVKFGKSIGRLWRSSLTREQLKIIRGQVRGAHKRGLKVRYWDLPGWPIGLRNHVWEELVREGVDVLNVDDLRAVGKLSW